MQEYSVITKNGYIAQYDTRKRAKHDRLHDKMIQLRENGLSVREIAKELDMPAGSIFYILKQYGLMLKSQSKPSLFYLSRSEYRDLTNKSDSSFDYYVGRYPDKVKRVNGKVYLHQDIVYDYALAHKAYHDSEERKRQNKGQ
jgi:hypothetical protein